MTFLRHKLTVTLLLTLLTFVFTFSAKAQTIAPAGALAPTSTSDIPASNLTASLIADRDTALSLYICGFCKTTDECCGLECDERLENKCSDEYQECLWDGVPITMGCGIGGLGVAGMPGAIIGGAACALGNAGACMLRRRNCRNDYVWHGNCVLTCIELEELKKSKAKKAKKGNKQSWWI